MPPFRKGKIMIQWELNTDAEPQGSSNGFWYDLIDGGYINLVDLIKNSEQLKQAEDAVRTLESLQDALENANLLNEF